MLSESPNEYSLPGVLHYLQAEWRQFERERNEWAIERAEFKSRVTLLEGERRGLENLRYDLMKRIKMLEYALREERKRHMKTAMPEVSAMSAKLLLDDDIELSLAPTPPMYNAEDAKKAKVADEMLRERSRDALKGCLQEINYLIATPSKFPMTRALSPVLHTPAAAQRHTKVPRYTSARATEKTPVDLLPSSPEEPPLPPMKEVEVPENVDEVAMMTNADKKKDEEPEIPKEESPEDLVLRFQKEYNMDEKPVKKTMKRAGRSIKSSSSYDTGDHQTGSHKTSSWKPHMKIKGHMDSVRAVAFHPTEEMAVTGSDDYTVKVWNLARKDRGRGPSKDSTNEAESSITYRGHTHSVTGVVISAEQNMVFSCSLDTTIGVWRLPPEGHGPSSAVDPTLSITQYVGHTDAIWDISLHNQFLASASADGSVKIWNTTARSEETLKYSLYMDGQRDDTKSCAPTSLDFMRADPSKMVVSYTNARVGVFDVEMGQFVRQLEDPTYTYDGTVATQINTIISHPTDRLIITGHEDNRIKLFDERSGDVLTLDGHLDGVTSLDVDLSGQYLISGGHDNSIRAWDLRNSNLCVWEATAHQRKADEGILSACCHRSLPFMMSGGADGIVKVYRGV